MFHYAKFAKEPTDETSLDERHTPIRHTAMKCMLVKCTPGELHA